MLNDLMQELIKYGQISGQKGFTPGISGNFSARVGEKILITASGSSNGFLEENDFSVIDSDGSVLEGNPKASSERFLHIEFYKQRPDMNAILHVHSPFLTAFAAAGFGLADAISPEIVYCFGKIPIADYALPGSEELVKNTSMFFKDYDVVLMKNHGVIVCGKNVKDAYLKLELAEEYAKTVIFTKLLGGANILSDEEVEKINSLKTK